ncbi:MAG: glycosyltransferase [Clostridia bacterium]|nr:glycosyltransferase [Clostridia bacterium]
MRILEVNDNDIYGKIFNGYKIMEELNKKDDFSIRQLVVNKVSNNPLSKKLYKQERMAYQDSFMHMQEQEQLSTHSMLSANGILIEKNEDFIESDLVHFHQVHNSRIPLESFYKTIKKKPSVISFHDMWFMTGRCVQTYGCDKWKSGCVGCKSLDTLFPMTFDNCSELWKIKSKIKDTDVDVIVHSKFMYDMVKECSFTKNLRVHEIPLGIEMSKYEFKLTKEEAKRKLNIFPSDMVIFFRENMELKGTNYVIEALKKIKNKNGITIVSCDQKGFLKEIEDEFNVIELGVLEEEKLLMCYNAADLFLMPSPGETFGMMAVEAMAAGIPTIVFNNTALPDTTGAPDAGILVNDRDSEDLYKKIEYYLNHPEEREKRGKVSKEFVAKKYDYNQYFEKVAEVYKSAYENQKYKIDKQYEEELFEIDYEDSNSKRLINKLNKIYNEYDKIFESVNKPEFLSNSKLDGDKIEYSNPNVLGILDKFNSFIYQELIENTEENIIRKEKTIHKSEKGNSKEEICGKQKEDKPKVSIIMPVYNGGKYVSMAIDSALRQTYDNIEIVVVNDGSKDNTDEVCRSYGEKIKYIKKENGGVSTALNRGIQEMTGDYFSWLSHDDLYYPEKVETEVNYLINNNLIGTDTILYSNYSTMDGNGKLMYDIKFDSKVLNKDSSLSLLKGAINGLTLLIPKKAFDEVGGFSESLRCIQDYKLWYDMYKYGYKFIHIPDILTVTRIHAEQVTNTSPKVVTEGNEFWLDVIKDFSDEDKIRIYGSVYEYYYELFKFFNDGPYDKAIEICKSKCEEMERENENKINQTKVSIVLPFYNDCDSTNRAIQSVLGQTHKNIEILLINNGSTDDIYTIKKIADENSNVIKFKEYTERQEKLKIWKDAINEISGEYIILFDQYSCMEKDRIRIQLSKMVLSGVSISDVSYYRNDNNNVYPIDTGFEDGDVVHKVINECYYRLPIIMLEKDYLVKNRILDSINTDYAVDEIIVLKEMIDNRILGINKPLTTIYRVDDESLELKLASIISCVSTDERFSKYPHELSILVERYKSLLNDEVNNGLTEDCIKQAHAEELERYAYMQTEECHEVEKIRNIINKLLFRKKIPYYKLDTDAIKNSGINKWYRKHKEKKERGK